ncbi:hypothetical protein F5Y16DRAFT_401899 [Xylariaceae sp. FL0255]|nr:hypothetical protein F5Y16DRAFT_401899 [Xylariaceae sp. FL0255]
MGDNLEFSEPLMDLDSNLPELLAVDLESSIAIFESRHLTAGPPAPGLSGIGTQRRHSIQHGSLAPLFVSELHAATITSSKSLQSIHQKYSGVFTPVERDYVKRASLSSCDSSVLLEVPSLSTQAHSILTVDTSSVESPTNSGQNNSSEHHNSPQRSWIDFDLEEDIPPTLAKHPSLSSSLPSPTPEPHFTTSAMPPESGAPVERRITITDDEGTYSFPLRLPPRRSSLHYQEAYLASKLASQLRSQSQSERASSLTSRLPNDTGDSTMTDTDWNSAIDDTPVSPCKLWLERNSDVQLQADIQSTEQPVARVASPEGESIHDSQPPRRSQDPTIAESGISTSLPEQDKYKDDTRSELFTGKVDVDAWLQASSQHEFETRRSGRLTPMPLSNSTLETLRVTVSCFPETILVSDSVTVETIRAASRGIRYAAAGRPSPICNGASTKSSDAKKQPSRQSKWKLSRLLSGSSSTDKNQEDIEPFSMSVDNLPSTSGKPAWVTVRAIFPQGTDYLCDSLYAHILAFNYITALCPRAALITPTATLQATQRSVPQHRHTSSWRRRIPTPTQQRPSSSSSSLSLGSDSGASISAQSYITIGAPKKAASILGIGEKSSRPATAASRMHATEQQQRPDSSAGRRASLARPGTPLDHRHSDSSEALCDLRLGLARCIAQIVATLRMAGGLMKREGNGEVDMERDENWCGDDYASRAVGPVEDPMFMQALCEVVRVSEMH